MTLLPSLADIPALSALFDDKEIQTPVVLTGWRDTLGINPRPARWIDKRAPGRVAVERALADVFIMESPPGSNRGYTIDAYNKACGVPEGSPYCASALAAWWRDAGLRLPPMPGDEFWTRNKLPTAYGPASTDAWRAWALVEALWMSEPVVGGAVVYGTGRDATHIGIVIRTSPVVMSFEANTTLDGHFSREGIAFDRKTLDRERKEMVLGYIDVPRVVPRAA